MLAKWPIRNKLLVGLGLLAVIVATLSISGFLGVYAYRGLVRDLRGRADELPLATKLASRVSDLRVSLTAIRAPGALGQPESAPSHPTTSDAPSPAIHPPFRRRSRGARRVLHATEPIRSRRPADQRHAPGARHGGAFAANALRRGQFWIAKPDWPADGARTERLAEKLDSLQSLAAELPSFLHRRIHDLAGDVRAEYRTMIGVNWVTTLSALFMAGLFVQLFYRWVFRPLRVLIRGSRQVAAGDFGYRIQLDSHDEMAELAQAFNDMTARFQAVRDDLDHQVQLRTKQVVRSEQLASVGFLAAGVAHEINNPLASIAMCAESLESRLAQIAPADAEQAALVGRYLRMIQTEAFRCKEITEKLLDFSRLGDVAHQDVDLRELVQGVIDMVRHLGRYQQKEIQLAPGEAVVAAVNCQEIKQVVLNLITYRLDALELGLGRAGDRLAGHASTSPR